MRGSLSRLRPGIKPFLSIRCAFLAVTKRPAGVYTPPHHSSHLESNFCRTSGAAMNLMVKRPSLGSLLLSLIPFAGACFSVSLWDRIHPMVLGIPFNLFWLISWLGLTPLVMWGAYRLEMRRGHEPESPGKAGGAR